MSPEYDIQLDVKYEHGTLIDVGAEAAAHEPWFNQTLTTVDDAVVRLGILEGDFHWHKHDDQDEFFLVLEGRLLIDLEGEETVTLGPLQGYTSARASCIERAPRGGPRSSCSNARASFRRAIVPEAQPQRPFAPPADATEVVIVRHGASAPAVPGVPFATHDGHGDPALAPEGERQARAVAERLAGEPFAAVFVTTLQRTVQTAAPLAEVLGLEPVVVPELREVHLGDWDGGEYRLRVAARDPVAVRALMEERWDVIPNAEASEPFAARVRAGVLTMVEALGPGAAGRGHPARRRHRRDLPSGHHEPPVRLHPRRQRLDHAAGGVRGRSLAAAQLQRHGPPRRRVVLLVTFGRSLREGRLG